MTARLVYRRAWRDLVKKKEWVRDGHGNPLEDIAPPHFGHLMAAREIEVKTLPPRWIPDGGCSLGVGDERGWWLLLVVVGGYRFLDRWGRGMATRRHPTSRIP